MKKTVLILSTLVLLPAIAMSKITGSCAPLDEDGNEIGTCTWTLDGDTLTFSGKGPMKDYGTITQNGLKTTDAPWNDRDSSLNTGSLYQIRNVVVEDGITSVGNNALSAARNITSITIGDDVKTIGDYAFFYANGASRSLLNLDLGKGVETLGQYSFHSDKVDNLILPEGLKSIGTSALRDVYGSVVLPNSLEYVGPVQFSDQLQSLVLPAHLIEKNGISSSSILHSNISQLYCPQEKEDFCVQLIEKIKNRDDLEGNFAQNLSYETYEKKGDRYIFGGTAYKSIKDFHNNEPVKRIYTIDEATQLSKPTGNTFKLRYK